MIYQVSHNFPANVGNWSGPYCYVEADSKEQAIEKAGPCPYDDPEGSDGLMAVEEEYTSAIAGEWQHL